MKVLIDWTIECITGLLKIIFTGTAADRIKITIALLLVIGSLVNKEYIFLENFIIISLFLGYIKAKEGKKQWVIA